MMRLVLLLLLGAGSAAAALLLGVPTSPHASARARALRAQSSADDATTMHFHLEDLRVNLAEAVHSENYSAASRLRDELAALERNEECAVLCANAAFYEALRSRDGDALEAIWADGPLGASCTRSYPGFPPLRGRVDILRCWREVASDAHLELSSLRCVLLRGGLSAVVTCVERRRTRNGIIGGYGGDADLSSTNIYEKSEAVGRWRLVLHQAEPARGSALASSMSEEEEEECYDEDVPGATG